MNELPKPVRKFRVIMLGNMRKYVVVLPLLAIIAAAQSASVAQKDASAQKTAPATNSSAAQPGAPKTPEAIVSFLLPDNIAYPERLKQVSASDAIAALAPAQAKETGVRANAIAYLLVLLSHEPDANRMRLTEALRNCTRDPESCDEHVVPYLENLFERGDRLVLDPLLDASERAEGDLAEALATGYGEMIAKDPRTFVTALSKRNAKDQRRLCHMVATGDGMGLPEEASVTVQDALGQMVRETGPVASTAMMCVNEIRAADKSNE